MYASVNWIMVILLGSHIRHKAVIWIRIKTYLSSSPPILVLKSKLIWIRSRNCGCLVTWFCYQLIAKPGNKTAAVPWPDPYTVWYSQIIHLFIASLGPGKGDIMVDAFQKNENYCNLVPKMTSKLTEAMVIPIIDAYIRQADLMG